jgi:hypothetical protein
MSHSEGQIPPLVKGDLVPRMMDYVDLRNDNAGGPLDQTKNIILRYLETARSDDFVGFDQMIEDISRHWPFHGTSKEDFQYALDALKSEGLILTQGDQLQINKVARVSRRWIRKAVQQAR